MTDSKIRYPRDVRIPIQFFGRFTPYDLGRLAGPAALAYGWVRLTGPATRTAAIVLLGAAAVGLVWYRLRPYGLPLEHLLYHVARWTTGRVTPSTSVDTVDDAVAETSAGTVVEAVRVTPVNLGMKDQDQQAALHQIYQDLLAQASYPIEIQSRQLPVTMESYIDSLDGNTNVDEFIAAYRARLREFTTTDAVTTHHYLIIRASGDDARTAVHQRCDEIADTVTGAGLTAERVTGMELQVLMQSFDPSDITAGRVRYDTGEDGGSSRYRRMAAITEYPDTLPLGWPVEFLQLDGRVDVVQHARPRNPANAGNTLRNTLQKLEAERASLVGGGHFGTNNIEAAIDDVNWMLDAVAKQSDSIVDHATYILAHGPSKEECDATFRRVRQRLRQHNIDYVEPRYRTDHAIRASSAVTSGGLNTALPMPASSAAGGFPFATRHRQENSGVLFGEDADDGTPVLEDRFGWDAGHVARMGRIGSGKSYGAKLALLRAYVAYDDLIIRIVDPKQEYDDISQLLGGSRITVDETDLDKVTPSYDVTRYTVSDRSEEHVPHLVDAVRHIYREVAASETRTIVVVDEAHRLLDDDEGRAVLSRFVRESRDTNTAITMISQNAADFTHSRAGRAILDNTPCKVFMRHERVPDSVEEYFRLSAQEVQDLLRLKTGGDHDYAEAVMKLGGRLDATLRVDATPAEEQIIEEGTVPNPDQVTPRKSSECSKRRDRSGRPEEDIDFSMIGIGTAPSSSTSTGLLDYLAALSPFRIGRALANTLSSNSIEEKIPNPAEDWKISRLGHVDPPDWLDEFKRRVYTAPDGTTFLCSIGAASKHPMIRKTARTVDGEGLVVLLTHESYFYSIYTEDPDDRNRAIALLGNSPAFDAAFVRRHADIIDLSNNP